MYGVARSLDVQVDLWHADLESFSYMLNRGTAGSDDIKSRGTSILIS